MFAMITWAVIGQRNQQYNPNPCISRAYESRVELLLRLLAPREKRESTREKKIPLKHHTAHLNTPLRIHRKHSIATPLSALIKNSTLQITWNLKQHTNLSVLLHHT
jgi:hypothetical protein